MKIFAALLLLSSTSAFALENGAGRVNCVGVNPHVEKVDFTLEVSEKGEASASAIFTNINDDGVNHEPFNAEFAPRDIMEASIGYQHVNFMFAHHNTVTKLFADGDMLGGASENDDNMAPFSGVLFYQSGNGNSHISRFQVTCKLLK